MNLMKTSTSLMGALLVASLLLPQPARAHCDTLDGSVVSAAKAALSKRDLTPVLKWIQKDEKAEVRAAFARALKVCAKGEEARELADRFFFETLVRLHRAGEAAPYTGLKPSGQLEPAVEEADRALEVGSTDKLVQLVTQEGAEGIRQRFAVARHLKEHVEDSVGAASEGGH